MTSEPRLPGVRNTVLSVPGGVVQAGVVHDGVHLHVG